MTRPMDRAYRDARNAMLDCLDEGTVDADGLANMQAAMAAMAANKRAFGLDRYNELRELLSEVERLPVREPVFIRHPPVINHPPEAWHHQVPYPYRLLKWDGPWIFVLLLTCMGLVWKPWLLLAGFIALLRVIVWCSFRFPLTTVFFTAFFRGLIGGRRRRWW